MIDFKKRLFENWTYPKLDKYVDRIEDRSGFMEFLKEKDGRGMPARIYVHVPFCRSFCPFCPYYKISPTEELVEAYIKAVTKELKMYADSPFYQGVKIDTVCFGGGDPAVLDTRHFETIMEVILHNFDLSQVENISVEGSVLNLLHSPEKIHCYAQYQVNRMSIGVQTFKEELRKKLQLKAAEKEIYTLFDLLRREGIDDISLDLLYNLPDQDLKDITCAIEKAMELQPTYIDYYGLNLYPGTRFMKMVFDGETFHDVPTNQKSIAMYKHIWGEMKKQGYHQVASMCYSKTRQEPHVYLARLLREDPVIAVGPSSRSYVGGRSYRNVTSLQQYIEAVENHEFPVEAGAELDENQLSEKLMVFFPVVLTLDKTRVANLKPYEGILDELKEAGYIKEEGNLLSITEEGRVWIPNIQRLFYNREQRKKELQTIFYSAKYKENPYNQDGMDI